MGKPRNRQCSDLLRVDSIVIEADSYGGRNVASASFTASIVGVRQHGIHNLVYPDHTFLVFEGVMLGCSKTFNYLFGRALNLSTDCELFMFAWTSFWKPGFVKFLTAASEETEEVVATDLVWGLGST
jgi:hypothetical protein